MRRTVAIVLVIGLAAAGAGFYLSEPARLAALIDLFRGESAITPGFIGMANFGRWRLICVRGPAPLQGLVAASAAAAKSDKAASTNTCRVNQEVRAPGAVADAKDSPGDVLAAANFSLLVAKRTPALMLRLPSTAEVGGAVSLRLDGSDVVTTVVRECAGGECLAAGAVSDSQWARLALAKTMQIVFPVAGKPSVLLDLPIEGLGDAISAMNHAQMPTPN